MEWSEAVMDDDYDDNVACFIQDGDRDVCFEVCIFNMFAFGAVKMVWHDIRVGSIRKGKY